MLGEDLAGCWKTVVDTIQEGVMIVSPEGRIVSVNRAMVELTGFAAAELIGRSCATLNCASCRVERNQDGRHWCTLFKAGRLNRQRCALIRRDGQPVQVLKNASLLRNEHGEVIGAVETITDISDLLARDTAIAAFKRELSLQDTFHGLVGASRAMQQVFDLIENAANSDAPVIIYGQSGTGKELVAKAVHERGARSLHPYVKVNCAALNEALLESELFGHVRGAFTGAHSDRTGRFEAAAGGSIFLDEIGDLPLITQVKLLRVLEEKEIERVGDHRPIAIDVRIISATNRDLSAMVAQGSFRQDLYYRINVIPITIPPLRDRMEDVPLLSEAFFRKMQLKSGKDIRAIGSRAMQLLTTYDWPGNVRELRSTFEYAFVTCQGGTIEPEDLPPSVRGLGTPVAPGPLTGPAVPTVSRESRRRQELIEALRTAQGNQSLAAQLLGVSRGTVWNWMKRYGLRSVRQLQD